MSMTKRWIDDLREKADAGDESAQETLSGAGLWQSEEDAEREAESFHYAEVQRESEEQLRHAEFQREIESNWFDSNADETDEIF